jgi:predicted DNA binding CopG/RHH family protein
MTGKKVTFGGKPPPTSVATPDDWVTSRVIPETEPVPEVKMKRLTLDVSEELHRKIKSACANRGVKMADEIRALLETHFSQ